MAITPPFAMAMAKRAVYEGVDTTLAAGLKLEGERFLETMLSDGSVSAMRAYVAQPLEARRAWLEKPPAAR